MAKEHVAATRRLAGLLSQKWGRHYSEVCGFLRSRLSFALARSSSRMLRGERYHEPRRQPTVGWESGDGLRLYR